MTSTFIAREAELPQFVGDDLALDFINTAYGVDEQAQDWLTSDAQVLEWLALAGIEAPPLKGRSGDLIKAAIALRENALALVAKRKAGATGDVTFLNKMLALGSAYQQLTWPKKQPPSVALEQRVTKVEGLLLPVAEALASLLSSADFSLVRQCECDDCTLWFHDQTKSHRRRWCSVKQCGNRMKVAAFRARQKKA